MLPFLIEQHSEKLRSIISYFPRHMSHILRMIYNYSGTMDLGTTGELTATRKLDNKSHGNNKMYRQAIDRA